jgi:hypothetical protein
MINFKQLELSQQLFDQLQQRYPDVALVDIVESGVYPNHIWVRMVMPADEDKEIEIGKLASEISTDILLDHGHHITIVSSVPEMKNQVA